VVEPQFNLKDKSVAVLDLHGTLTPVMSIWQYLLEGLSRWSDYEGMVVGLRSGELTYRYCCETITYNLKGTPLEVIEDIISTLPVTDGVVNFVEFLKNKDISIWLLTTGLGHAGEVLKKRFPVDKVLGNWFEVTDGMLTGKLIFNVDMGAKGDVLKKTLMEEGLVGGQCLALGDTLGDLEVFKTCGLSIAVSPKDKGLDELADLVIDISQFTELPELLGGEV